MPAKKKKGKGSKLARMSEEERLRYLQHRAELELEAKRRKQQLIAVFTKSKLKREEAFSRLNTAKINEQWRFILRQIKCKELYDDLEYLWKNFDRTLRAKDAVIHKFYEELKIADLDHRRLQEAHFEMIDKLIGRFRLRLGSMHDNYKSSIAKIEIGEMKELDDLHFELSNECRYLETVKFAQSKCANETLMKTLTRNATSTRSVEYWKEEDIMQIEERIGDRMEDLWRQMNDLMLNYEESSGVKRKQYEYLKEQDDIMRLEASQFPRLQSQLRSSVEILKKNRDKLSQEHFQRIEELKNQVDRMNSKIWKSRQDMRINETADSLRLKRSSVIGVSLIKELQKMEKKGAALLMLVKLCTSLEPPALAVKKYAIQWTETSDEINDNEPCVISPYDKMDKFWEQYNHVKAENIHKRREREHLSLENKRLRHKLRTYLITLARIPICRPHTSI